MGKRSGCALECGLYVCVRIKQSSEGDLEAAGWWRHSPTLCHIGGEAGVTVVRIFNFSNLHLTYYIHTYILQSYRHSA